MNDNYDPSHLATEEEYKQATQAVPILREEIEKEEDYYARIVLKVKIGEHIMNIMSYLYGLSLGDCEEFSELVSAFVNIKRSQKKRQIQDLEKLL